jgi:homoserine kinase type II
VSDAAPPARPEYSVELVTEVAQALGLAARSGWSDVGGSWALNLRVTDAFLGPVVARVHRRSVTEQRLAAEQAARQALLHAGLPAVPTITGASGSTINRLGNGHLVELEPFVGSTARMRTPALLTTGFAMLARSHDALAAAALPVGALTVPWSNHIETSAAADATRAGAERMRGWARSHLSAFADHVVEHVDLVTRLESSVTGLPRQVVHGDFWDNNVLFDRGRVVAVLDFGFMGERPRIDDLALPIWFYLLEPGHALPTADDIRVVRGLLDAYDAASSAPLSTAERLALPLAVARQPAWSAGRWVRVLDRPEALAHAEAAALELPVAQAVLTRLDVWQRVLTA